MNKAPYETFLYIFYIYNYKSYILCQNYCFKQRLPTIPLKKNEETYNLVSVAEL